MSLNTGNAILSNAITVDGSYNVGIGTSTPAAALHITGAVGAAPAANGVMLGVQSNYAVIHLNGTSGAGSLIDFSTSGTDYKGRIEYDNTSNWMRFGTDGAERMRIASTGSVGIGTTPPSTTNFSHLFVGRNISMFSGSSTDIYIGSNFYYDGGFKVRYSEASAMINTNSGDIIFQNSSSGTAGGAFNGIERMRITSGGSIAINNPSDKSEPLSVQGFSGNWTAFFQASTTAGNSYGPLVYAGTSSGDTSFYVASASGASVFLRVRGDGYFQLPSTYNNTTTNAVNMTISSSGYVERYTSSSLRYKENIKEWDGNGLQTILSLKPVEYTYKSDYYRLPNKIMLGLIAEEVEQVSHYFVDYENEDRTGIVENVRYADLVLPLIKAVQELNQKVEAQKQQINQLINK